MTEKKSPEEKKRWSKAYRLAEELSKEVSGEKEKPLKVKNKSELLQPLKSREGFSQYYEKIINVLKMYVDLDEQYYPLIAVWILGTYLHKQFPAYPYLFFNAMKGSGKTRILKIIAQLSKNGKVAGSMTEAVLFRTASKRTLCIDEFESMNAKGNENLKLLLNSAYKRGTTIERMMKKKTVEGESQVVEAFEVYCPIALANIWGMENVLGDRCLEIILERSSKTEIIKLVENFEYDKEFNLVRNSLNDLTKDYDENLNLFGQIFDDWNFYQKNVVNKVNDVSSVNKVNDVSNEENTYDIYDNYNIYDKKTLFSEIDGTEICGRELELFLPLFLVADLINKNVLSNLLELSRNVVKKKKETDREDNKDVKLIEFISKSTYDGFVNVNDVVKDFTNYSGDDEKFNTSRSISRALNRLNLILDKRSTGKQRQIKLNILKAQEKFKIFAPQDIDFSQGGLFKDG